MEYQRGDRVLLTSRPEYGPGQVLEDNNGGNVSVFFVNVGVKKYGPEAELELLQGDQAKHPVLDNLYVDKDGKVTQKYRKMEDLVARFLELFPEGYDTPKYLGEERDYKVAANKSFREKLGKVELDQLIEAGDFEEIKKRSLSVISKTNLVFPNETMALKDGLADEKVQEQFGRALHGILYGDGELKARVESFIEALFSANAPKWTLLTYFLFIGQPDRYIFLKPTASKQATEVFGYNMLYQSELNWQTFKAHQDFAEYLFDLLFEMGPPLRPKDMIDVQGFVYCVSDLY